jgi:hypothetical protein
MKKYIGKFVGLNKIKSISISDEKSYLGSDKISIVFENSTIGSYPKWMFELIVQDKECDLNKLRELRVNPTLEKIIAILAEAELTQDEIMYSLQRLPNILGSNLDKAKEILFGKSEYSTTLYDIEKIINPKK